MTREKESVLHELSCAFLTQNVEGFDANVGTRSEREYAGIVAKNRPEGNTYFTRKG